MNLQKNEYIKKAFDNYLKIIGTILFIKFLPGLISIFEAEFSKNHINLPFLVHGILGGPLLLLLIFYRERNLFYIQSNKLNLNLLLFCLISAIVNDPITSISHDYLKFIFPSLNEGELINLTYTIWVIFVVILFIFSQFEDFFKKYRPLTKKVLGGLILIFFWPFIINIPLIPYHINGFFFYNATDDINKTAHNLTDNLSNNEEKSKALLNWQLNNMNDIYGRYLLTEKPYIVINRASNNYNLAMYYKHGACGDFGILLSELANASGIENRRVYAPGENHEWVEVKINNSKSTWANVDAAWLWPQKKYVYNDFNAYGNLSRVYYIEPGTNKQIDVTKNYSMTGNISVYVNVANENVTTFNITIISQSNFSVVEGNPDAKGFYNFTLGSNNYKVIAKKDYFGGLFSLIAVNQSISLRENETTMIALKPKISF
jgi:uncharacterized membrane protein YobD (UPF0266 family)